MWYIFGLFHIQFLHFLFMKTWQPCCCVSVCLRLFEPANAKQPFSILTILIFARVHPLSWNIIIMNRLAISSLRLASGALRGSPHRYLSTGRSLAAGKEVRFGTEVRQEMLKGVDVLADAVSVTMGPKVRFMTITVAFNSWNFVYVFFVV